MGAIVISALRAGQRGATCVLIQPQQKGGSAAPYDPPGSAPANTDLQGIVITRI